MASFNKVIMMGNLTRDPQLSYLPSQTPVCEFGLATNHRWRGQNGEQREESCFVDCRCYGKQAETFNQYMSKGKPVMIEGRLQLDMWESAEGQKRSKHRILVERFYFIGAPTGPRPGAAPGAATGAPRQAQQHAAPPPPPPGGEDEGGYDRPPADEPPPPAAGGEEIPF
jgi:single-strand DNA-binding protein